MALVISIAVWDLIFQIPFGFRGDQAFATATTVPLFDNGADNVADLKNRFCGRIFAADEDQTADNVFATAATAISVCSKGPKFKNHYHIVTSTSMSRLVTPHVTNWD